MGSKFLRILASWKQNPLHLRRVIVGDSPARAHLIFSSGRCALLGMPELLRVPDGAAGRVPEVVQGHLLTVVAPLPLGLRNELLVLRCGLPDVFHKLLFPRVLYLLALSVCLTMHVCHGFIYSLSFLPFQNTTLLVLACDQTLFGSFKSLKLLMYLSWHRC